MPLPPLPRSFRLKCQGIGADPKTGSDMDFYDWLAGDNKPAVLAELARYAMDLIKEEQDPQTLYDMMLEFKRGVSNEEYIAWSQVLGTITPPTHPLHEAIKRVQLESN